MWQSGTTQDPGVVLLLWKTWLGQLVKFDWGLWSKGI